MKFTVRDLVYIAIFGALWGAAEMTIGAYLHVVYPPLTYAFIPGLIMAAIGITIALVGRLFVPRAGSVLMMGLVVAMLKALSIGGVKLGPLIAIVAESLLAELGLALAGQPSRLGFVLAGSLAVLWCPFHKPLVGSILLGQTAYKMLLGMIGRAARLLGFDARHGMAIMALLLLIHIAAGGAAGWLAWDLGGAVRDRLAR